MSKNLHETRRSNITMSAAVASGTLSGAVIPLGSDGLIGYALTDRVTQADIDNYADGAKLPPQGLKDGEATVELAGIGTSVWLEVNAAVTLWAKVYRTPGGAFSPTSSGNTQVGYALKAATASGQKIPVGLRSA